MSLSSSSLPYTEQPFPHVLPSLKPTRAPVFSTGQGTHSSPHADLILTLHKLGWNITKISSVITGTPARAYHVIKAVTSNIPPLPFDQLFPHIPFQRLIPEEFVQEFKDDQAKRLVPYSSSKRLNQYDIHLIKILFMIGWKKVRIAELYNTSAVSITLYTQDIEPYSVAELRDLLPQLFTTDQPTTNQPTTNQPTTNQPTTNQPTTNQPTTNEECLND